MDTIAGLERALGSGDPAGDKARKARKARKFAEAYGGGALKSIAEVFNAMTPEERAGRVTEAERERRRLDALRDYTPIARQGDILSVPVEDEARTVYLGSGQWPQPVRMPDGGYIWLDHTPSKPPLADRRVDWGTGWPHVPGSRAPVSERVEAHFRHRERSGHTVAVSLSNMLERLESVESELARTRERVDELEAGRTVAAPETVPVDQEGGIMFGQMSRDFNRRVDEKLARVRAEHKAEDDKKTLHERRAQEARAEKVNVIVDHVAAGMASMSFLALIWVVAQKLLGG